MFTQRANYTHVKNRDLKLFKMIKISENLKIIFQTKLLNKKRGFTNKILLHIDKHQLLF